MILKNAPLAEVVVDVQWQTVPLSAIPGAGVDPFFPQLEKSFPERAKTLGFHLVERLVPIEMPLEIVVHQPIYRFRMGANSWPLYQIGPGLFSANITPPYEGWEKFLPIVLQGLDAVFSDDAIPMSYRKPKIVQLRYLDVFSKRHGCEDPAIFLKNNFALTFGFTEDFERRIGGSALTGTADLRLKITDIPGATLTIKTGPNSKNPSELVVDMSVSSESVGDKFDTESVREWLNKAHQVVDKAFEHLTSDSLKEVMRGEKV